MIKMNKNLAYLIIVLGFLLILSACKFPKITKDKEQSERVPAQKSVEKEKSIPKKGNQYSLELHRWGVHNDGTHSKETTEGINKALQWASNQGYTAFYVPEGIYLITKGKSDFDASARINLVSNMTFLLDDKAVIQKETNGFEIYSTLYLGPDIKNVTIKGGTLRGDRDTHDYTQKGEATDGTHEWGNGITTAGPSDVVIEGVKIEKFTGDGIEIGGNTVFGQYITEEDLELGGINENGQPIPQDGKIRSNNYEVSNFNHSVYQDPHFRNLMMWIPEGVEGTYDLFYYRKDHTFIKKDGNQRYNSTWGYSHIPDDADYFKVVFNAHSTKGVKVNRMTVAITENMTIQNCDIGYNRRQGITVGASENIQILNNKIHHTKGTAPESGIDIEPGFYPAINTLIKGNRFLENVIQMVFSYGGNATVEDNYFGPNRKDGVGFSINPNYYGATVVNNEFDRTNFVTWGNTKFINNRLISSSASFEGGSEVIVDQVNGVDAYLGFTQTEEGGIQVSNVSLKSSKNKKKRGGIAVYGEPIHLKAITIQDNNEFTGEGNSQNIYDQVTFKNISEMKLTPGSYNDCSASGGEFELSSPGKYVLNHCEFKNSTLYTYNQKTNVTIQQSTFKNEKSSNGPAILALEAKNIKVLNNTFDIKTDKGEESPIIQIGRDASERDQTKILGAAIKGNKLSTNINRVGIDTINGGIGAPAYVIEENTLYNATLKLKTNDINNRNEILK